MKKILIVVWLLIHVFTIGFGQKSSIIVSDDDRAIYSFVLDEYVKENIHKLPETSILVEYNFLTTYKLPCRIDKFNIEVINLNKNFF